MKANFLYTFVILYTKCYSVYIDFHRFYRTKMLKPHTCDAADAVNLQPSAACEVIHDPGNVDTCGNEEMQANEASSTKSGHNPEPDPAYICATFV